MNYHTFKPRFHELIRSKSKVTTIRAKTRVKPGELFSLRYWEGRPYRSKMAFLGTATCLSVKLIWIHEHTIFIDYPKVVDLNIIASADGFKTFLEMSEYFYNNYKLPFSGVLITWGSSFCPSNSAMDGIPPFAQNTDQPPA